MIDLSLLPDGGVGWLDASGESPDIVISTRVRLARNLEGYAFSAVCSSSKIGLGVNPARAAGGTTYTSDRTWMVMLAGGFYLTERTPGVATMLRDGEHCAFYDDTESCLAQCDRYLADAAQRNSIRVAGEAFVRANHTYDQRISNLLENRAFVNPL